MREVDAVWHKVTSGDGKAKKKSPKKKRRAHDVFLNELCTLFGVELTASQKARRKAVMDKVHSLLVTTEAMPTTSPLPPLSPPRRSPRRSPRRVSRDSPPPHLPPLQ
jgi:hypothetical protein